jgi:tetratricopeptide (TPR) repeat protein
MCRGGKVGQLNMGSSRFSRAFRTLLLAQTIGVLAWQGAAFADSSQVINLNNEGVKALNAQNFPAAVQAFQKALNIDPNYQLARDNLAIAHNNYGLQLKNNPKAALKEFHQALYLNPANPTTQSNVEGIIKMMGKNPRSFADRVALANDARHSGDFIGAIIEFLEALKIKDDPKIHMNLGEVYRVLDQNDKAIEQFKIAASAGDSAEIEVKLGQAYQAKGDLNNAIQCYGKAITYKSDDPEVQEALITGWSKALEENPLAPENHIGLGQAYQYRGDFGQARGEYRQALSLAANKNSGIAQIAQKLLDSLPAAEKAASFTKHVDLGISLQNQKQYDAAIDEYKKALEADPNNADILVNIGSAYQQKGDLQNALTSYQAALSKAPNNAAAQEGKKTVSDLIQDKMLGDTSKAADDLFKQGRYDEAIAKYKQLVQLNPQDAGSHFDLGASYQAKKDYDLAVTEYRMAISLDPKNTQYKKALADCFDAQSEPIIQQAFQKFKDKDYAGAIDLYKQALTLKPDSAALWFNVASAEYQRQNFQAARDAYTKALQIDPKGQVNDIYFIAAIDENFGRGSDAIGNYQRYLAQAPTGTYVQQAKDRLQVLNKNPNDTIKIKSEAELAQLHDASDSFQKAVQAQQQGNYDAAIPLYQKAISVGNQVKMDPITLGSYIYSLGTAYQHQQDYNNAISSYQQAITLDPKNKDYASVLAQVKDLKAGPMIDDAVKKQTSGDLAGAIAGYQAAAQISPNNARLWTNLGTAYQQSDQFSQARDAYQKGYDLDNKNEVGDLYLMGAIDENYNQGARALQEYLKYLAQAPKGDYVSQARGRVAALQANVGNAAKLTTTADAKAAKAAGDAFDDGVKLQQAGKYDEAIASYQKAAGINEKEPAYPYAIGTAYQAKGDVPHAVAFYQKALSLAPPNANQTYLKALTDAKGLSAAPLMDEALKKHSAKDYAGAIDLYQKALDIDPNNARGWTNMAAAYQAADNFAKAHQSYEKALSIDPKGEADNWYFLGQLDENNSQASLAIDDYKKYLLAQPRGSYADSAQKRLNSLRMNPNSVQKMSTSADQAKSAAGQEAYDKAVKLQTDNKFDDAIAAYGQAIAAQPNEPSFYYGLGTAYQGRAATKPDSSEDYKKDFQSAIDNYKKAFSLNPREATYKQTLNGAMQALAAPLVNSAIEKQTKTNDLKGAIADYEAALRLYYDDSGTHMNLGTAYQADNNLPKAIDEYKKAIQLDPKNADVHYFLGTADEGVKQPAAAAAEYRRYLQIAPTGQYANDVRGRLKLLAPAGRR